jgi:hypothetical protein
MSRDVLAEGTEKNKTVTLFEVLTALKIFVFAFWVVTPCRLADMYQCF